MKWARVKQAKELAYAGLSLEQRDQAKQNDAACFHEYTSVSSLEKAMIQPEKLWVAYKIPKNRFFLKHQSFEQFRHNYEVFCGGYLYYHDNRLNCFRKPDAKPVDHTVYFKWVEVKTKGKEHYVVGMFLSPAPVRKKGHSFWGDADATKHFFEVETPPKGKKLPLKEKKTKALMQTLETGVNDLVDQIDPPPPPPPPPPSLH
jgi:hypothetical protein